MMSMNSLWHTEDGSGMVSAEILHQAVALLKAGELVAFPTETVYGLGANAEDTHALKKLYEVKGRPLQHPVIVHLGSTHQLTDWACDIPEAAWLLAQAFWPGPLTLILKRTARVPDAVTGGQETVGLRVPGHPVALALLKAFQGGVAGPSANRFGRLSPTSAAHVRADLGTDVACVLDGGACNVGVESTIVAFQDGGRPVVLRPGIITSQQIAEVLSENRPDADVRLWTPDSPTSVIRVPGTLASHYAPTTPLALYATEQLQAQATECLRQGQRIGVLARFAPPDAWGSPAQLVWRCLSEQPQAYAQALYAALRELDGLQLDQILVQAVPTTGDAEAWAAVADRLRRAAF